MHAKGDATSPATGNNAQDDIDRLVQELNLATVSNDARGQTTKGQTQGNSLADTAVICSQSTCQHPYPAYNPFWLSHHRLAQAMPGEQQPLVQGERQLVRPLLCWQLTPRL
jgi:hypothetical protein